MKNYNKYTRGYFMPPAECMKWTQKDHIAEAPIWCSVDLRDGNQSLITPMDLDQKLRFFQFLVKLGFKEIEISFPAASDTEFNFVRTLIERDLIPDDVTIQVLTQSREHIVKRTFEAIQGAKNVVVHLYNSTSVAQREQVFKKSKEEVIEIAVSGAKLLKEYASEMEGNIRFEYSPESFTGTEVEFSLEICNAVLDIWKPTKSNKAIINLPSTVQMSMPHVYASQIEYMCDNLNYRDAVVVSVHPHNDRGSGVCDAELGVLAGADRVEGTLFGNGERTGNADIVTLALNLFSHGIDPKLNFENMADVREIYEDVTNMRVYERHPYSGELVFTAFSGSHQDAIAKGMNWRQENNCEYWNVPYLLIDPKDIGRDYDGDVIRINSQSGKGGIGYILEQKYGFNLPAKMREAFSYMTKGISDNLHKELSTDEVYDIFIEKYVNVNNPVKIEESHFVQKGCIGATVTITTNGQTDEWYAEGNGRLDAVSNAIKKCIGAEFTITMYTEHALETGSNSKAVAYVGVGYEDNKIAWGAGVDNDIITASINALVSAVNNRI